MFLRTALLSLCLAAVPFAAQAATVNWNFESGSSTTSATTGSGYGNKMTFTSTGVSVVATGWALTGGANNTSFETGELSRFSTGLGNCNREEGTGCPDPSHQVDNSGQYDFVLFQFSAPVRPLSITINPYGLYDRDVTYYVGNAANPLNLNGVTLAGLSGLGFTAAINNDSTISTDARTVALTSGYVNSLLIGSRVGGDNFVDRFKISSMSAQTATPEPATWGLCGAVLVGIALSRRFRRTA